MIYLYFSVLFLFVLFSFFLCFIILAQESKSLGMGASFGGEAAGTLLGGSSAEILKKITRYAATVFLVGSVVISVWTSSLNNNVQKAPEVEVAQEAE